MESSHIIQPRSIVKTSWEFFKQHWKKLLGFFGVLILPSFIVGILEVLIENLIPGSTTLVVNAIGESQRVFVAPWNIVMTILNIASSILSLYLSIGMIKAWLKMLHNQFPELSIFKETTSNQTLQMIIGSILYTIITAVGLVLLVIPGLIFGVRLMFFQYYVAEGMSAIDSLKASRNVTKGQFRKLLGLSLIYVLIALIVVAIIGTLIAIGVGAGIAFIIIPIVVIIALIAIYALFGIAGFSTAKVYMILKGEK